MKSLTTASTSSASRFWHPAPLSSVVLIAGSLLLAMVLAEGVLRLVPGLLSVELQQLIQADADDTGIAHPYIGHLHKPNNTFILAGRDFRAAPIRTAMVFVMLGPGLRKPRLSPSEIR